MRSADTAILLDQSLRVQPPDGRSGMPAVNQRLGDLCQTPDGASAEGGSYADDRRLRACPGPNEGGPQFLAQPVGIAPEKVDNADRG